MPASGSTSGSPEGNVNGNKKRGKKRIRSFTADERASHSAIEKQRREALNASFIDLARLVPALAPVHRLSKSLIVQESIQYLQAQREMCLAAATELQAIIAENIELISEVNVWRTQYGIAGTKPREIEPLGNATQALLKFDQQVLGTFPAGFGDNGPGGEHEEERAENGNEPVVEERDPISTSFLQLTAPHAMVGSHIGVPAEPLVDMSGSHGLNPASIDLTTLMGLPSDSSMNGIHNPTQRSNPHGEEHSSLIDAYGFPSHTDMTSSADFADMNLNQNIYHDYTGQVPELDYYLGPANELSSFGYVP